MTGTNYFQLWQTDPSTVRAPSKLLVTHSLSILAGLECRLDVVRSSKARIALMLQVAGSRMVVPTAKPVCAARLGATLIGESSSNCRSELTVRAVATGQQHSKRCTGLYDAHWCCRRHSVAVRFIRQRCRRCESCHSSPC